MKLTQAYIERIRQINTDYVHLELASVDDSLKRVKPGESLLVRLVDADPEVERWDPYLREHWWPLGVTGQGILLVERPVDHRYEPGQMLSLLGPVGKPYHFQETMRNLLLIAYDTEPTPLTVMIPLLLRHQINVTLVLLGAARGYQTAHLAPEVEVIHGDDDINGADRDATLKWADQIFTVTAQDDEQQRLAFLLAALREQHGKVPRNYVFGVFRPLLPCGVGACYACTLRTRKGNRLTCVDGPAFDLTQVKLPE